MRVIIAGSRSITDPECVERAVAHAGFEITQVVSGGAFGPDSFAIAYADKHHIPCRVFRPDWRLGPKAGPARNFKMAKNADALIAIWDGKSRGTANMIAWAAYNRLQIKVFVKLGPPAESTADGPRKD